MGLVPGQQLGHAMFSNNMRRFFLILFVVLLLLFFFYIFISSIKPGPEQKILPKNPPTPTSVSRSYPLPSGIKPTQGGKIEINGVKLNNFFNSSKVINENKDILISKTDKYQIEYFSLFNSFLISIESAPFEENKILAEQDLINKLGVSKEAACRLPVNITTPQSANPEFAGTNYSLSFCTGD